jgi:hypothetical protein
VLVNLKSLKPNPMRDFAIDPMDEEVVERLKESIEDFGFWGGVVCRQTDDEIQIAAGHHRIAAAIEAGIRSADLHVVNGDTDDAWMIRVYANENATQRGNSGTAQAGSVAAAVRFIAKAILTGTEIEGVEISTPKMVEQGIGWRPVVQFLDGVPGINMGSVQQALANLKASGDYGRIIGEVQAEIERENAEALAALKAAEEEQARMQAEREEAERRQEEAEAARKKAAAEAKVAREDADRKRAAEAAKQAELDRQRAEAEAKLAEKRRAAQAEEMKQFDSLRKTRDSAAKAATTAAARPKTFDFEGVAKHLKNAHQIDVFRKHVTGQGIAPYLPVANQPALAEAVVADAKKHGRELSGDFIKERITALVLDVKQEERQITKDEEEQIRRREKAERIKHFCNNIAWALGSIATNGNKLKEEIRDWPAGEPIPIPQKLRNAMDTTTKIIDLLRKLV